MSAVYMAGNKGEKVRGDCWVSFCPDSSGSLDIYLKSTVEKLYGARIKSLVKDVFDFFDIGSGVVEIEDSGAFDFVIAARAEASIKQMASTEKNYLQELIPENHYQSTRTQMRLSRLYLPGNSPHMMINAGVHNPNAIILDLEDSVAVARKDEARILVRNSLRQVDFLGAERMVRINQLPMGIADLQQIVAHNLHLILIPKCESGEAIEEVNANIDAIRSREGIEKEIFLMPIIESSKGVTNAVEIAGAATNVVAMSIGLEDYTADIGVRRTLGGEESLYARSYLVNVCKSHKIQPIDSVFSDVGDMEALAKNVEKSKQLGFEGMGCIHPRQIPVIHKGYAPDDVEIAKAKKVVLAFDQALAQGLGVVSIGSKMIDPPVVERAERVLEQAITMDILNENWRSDHV